MSYSSSSDKCDHTLTSGWYRFRGAAGTMMPTSCVPTYRCGTQIPGWFFGSLPSPSDGEFQAEVCYNWNSNCCFWSSKIWVRNCGSFYVYYLQSAATGCNQRYCGNGAQGSEGSNWKYGETVSHVYGPNDWDKVSRHCIENAQSPINIDTVNTNNFYKYGPLTRFHFTVDRWWESLTVNLVNNGHAPTFEVVGSTASLTGGPWGSDLYRLEQFHIHFGCTSQEGSEHTVNRFAYSGELHLVFYNTKYQDFKTAANKYDGLTVIGVFLLENNVGATNPELQKLSSEMRRVTTADENFKIPLRVNLYTLVPRLSDLSRTSFYSYRGSLTTPPCYQSVNWIVLEPWIPASRDVMVAMRSLKDHEGHAMCNNFRPIQPLNRRKFGLYTY